MRIGLSGFNRFSGVALAILAASTVSVVAQRTTAPTTATVSGIVFDNGAGAHPVRDALVMIGGIDVGLVRATTTDDAGRFVFSGIPSGRFILSAGKSRYLAAMYGAARRGRPGSVVTIHAGDAIKDLKLALERGGAIGGRVIDEQGQPVAGARVRILGRRVVGTEVALTGDAGEPATVTTDDRGAFRVFDLPPGDYVVGVQPRGLTSGEARILRPEDLDAGASHSPPPPANGAAVGYSPTYFPGTPLAEKAAVVTVGAGEERSNIEIRMALARFARIDGTLSGMDRIAQHQITLRPRGFESYGTVIYAQTVRAAPDGRFSFTNVPPGEYTIFARTLPPPNGAPGGMPPAPPPPPSWAIADVSVNGTDVSNLSLAWQPSLGVTGRVQFEGLSQLPADIRVRVGVRSTPASNVPNPPEQTLVDAGGHFSLSGLLPGKYWITVTIPANPTTQVPDWFAKSAMVDGVDALDVAFDVKPGAARDIVLTLTDDAQQIDGAVKTSAGQPAADCPVIVFPADPHLWFPQSRRIVVRRSNEAGAWLFGLASALPAGDYYVAAAPDLAAGEQFDPGLLTDLAKSAQRVAIGANDSKTLSLVIPRGR